MLLALVHLGFDPMLVALVVLAVLAALGCAHFLSTKRKEGIVRSRAFYRAATLAREAGAPHHEKYYLAKATGDIFEAARQTHEIEELAIDTARARDAMDSASEHWLLKEASDPRRRRKIIHDIERLEKDHHNDELGALLAAEKKILGGVRETATVPDGAGGTTTVPVQQVHHHYHGDAKPAEAPKPEEKPAAPAHPPVVVNVHPTPAPPAPGTPSAPVATPA